MYRTIFSSKLFEQRGIHVKPNNYKDQRKHVTASWEPLAPLRPLVVLDEVELRATIPCWLHPAAVIWRHLLLRGAGAYREGMPAPRRNPRQRMLAICAGTSTEGKERVQCWGQDKRDAVSSADSSAGSNHGHGAARAPSAPQWTILMSNIPPFDKSRATGHGAEDMAAGNDGEWRVRKLINVGKGSDAPASGRAERSIWTTEAVSGCLWPAGQPAAVSSIWKCNEMSISWLNTLPPCFELWVETLTW